MGPRAISLLIAALYMSGCGPSPADVVYRNGRIYTVNEAQPWVEAVAIKDGAFQVVGSNADVDAVTGGGTEVVDLGGRMVMPGLIDVHVHPLSVTRSYTHRQHIGMAVVDLQGG